MRILMIGLGDIARKAYLPVLAAVPGLEIHLATRRAEVLEELGARYRIQHLYSGLDEALGATCFDAAFVHASTQAHPALVQALLLRGIPVMVDKPLADNLDDAAQLIELAIRQNVLLAVGFNRRFAPDYTALCEKPRSMLLMQKHRHAQTAPIRQTVFDDFVHVVDTLRFVAPERVVQESAEAIVRDGLLEAITLTLGGPSYTAVGLMHRASGLDEESFEIMGAGGKHSVLNLAERVEFDGIEHRSRRGDWTSVARQRGFDAMCTYFLKSAQERRPTAADDLLETHRICEMIVRQAEASIR